MIIFGTRGVTTTKERGQFTCPQCETNQDYKHKKVTKFFTLYFIPIIPLGSRGEYVECQRCKGTFVPRVLEYQPDQGRDAFMAEYEKAIRHSMVLMMLADGVIDDQEMETVHLIINKFSHNDMTLDELKRYVDDVQKSPQDVSTYLKGVAPSLNEHGKEVIIQCAISVAAADGHIDDSEMDLIKEIAKVMDMSGSHLKGILHDMTAPQIGVSDN